MRERELEQVAGDSTIAVPTCSSAAIIETGIDVPRANTIIIERAIALALLSCTSFEAGWAAQTAGPTLTCSRPTSRP